MTQRIKGQIANVKYFVVVPDLYALDTDGGLLLPSGDRVQSLSDAYAIEMIGKTLVVSGKSETYMLDEDKNLTRLDYYLSLSGFMNGPSYICFGIYNSYQGYITINIETLEVENFWELPVSVNGIHAVSEQFFVSRKGNIVTLNSILDGAEIWRYSSPTPVYGNVFIAENTILFTTKDKKLRSVSIQDGDQVWSLEDVHGFNSFVSKNIFYTLNGRRYEAIKIDQGQRTDCAMLQYEEADLFVQISGDKSFSNNNIYFSNQLSLHVGCFSIDKLQVEWVYKIENPTCPENWLERPLFNNGTLYVLDNNKMLYIIDAS